MLINLKYTVNLISYYFLHVRFIPSHKYHLGYGSLSASLLTSTLRTTLMDFDYFHTMQGVFFLNINQTINSHPSNPLEPITDFFSPTVAFSLFCKYAKLFPALGLCPNCIFCIKHYSPLLALLFHSQLKCHLRETFSALSKVNQKKKKKWEVLITLLIWKVMHGWNEC